MDLSFLSEADNAALKLELAKAAMERAKFDFEQAKAAYDSVLGQADAHGIPKAKLKKLTEERIQALFETGIVPRVEFATPAKPSEPKRPRKAKKEITEENSVEEETIEDAKV